MAKFISKFQEPGLSKADLDNVSMKLTTEFVAKFKFFLCPNCCRNSKRLLASVEVGLDHFEDFGIAWTASAAGPRQPAQRFQWKRIVAKPRPARTIDVPTPNLANVRATLRAVLEHIGVTELAGRVKLWKGDGCVSNTHTQQSSPYYIIVIVNSAIIET